MSKLFLTILIIILALPAVWLPIASSRAGRAGTPAQIIRGKVPSSAEVVFPENSQTYVIDCQSDNVRWDHRSHSEIIGSGLTFSIGNLSVPFLLKEWGSPLIDMGKVDPSPAAHERYLAAFLENASKVGAQSIEDYVGWAVVEPENGRWDWSAYRNNAKMIAGCGLSYTPFVWIQNLPRWVRSDPSYPRARCVEHGLECEALSVFSTNTMQIYDRFFARMASDFGERIDLLRIGAPNDFGETAYPVGAATFAFPDRHIHPGFWVDEADARAHFAETMRAKYGAVAALNRAWGTQFASFDRLGYPPDASRRRWWLDFVNWYHDAHTEKMGEIFDVVAARFPSTPLKMNLGFPNERIAYGQDISGLVKAVSKRRQQLRTPTGPSVPFFYTKRVATAVHFYGLTGFSSEPQDGEVPVKDIAYAAFKDLTTAVTSHFDYVPNMVRGKDSIEAERLLWRGKYPETDTALFFSTTAHRLDDSQREQGFKGYPDRLAPFTEGLRDVVDYDVADERLVSDGALANYRVLVWPVGFIAEATTLSHLREWVEGGGVLVVGALADVATIEGDRGAFANLPSGKTVSLGKGTIFDASGDLDRLAFIVANREYAQSGAVPSSALLPPLDRVVDGVLVSEFADGIMLFNTKETEVTKALSMPAGEWRLSYDGIPQQVVLPPLAIRWVDGRAGRTVASVSAASYVSTSLAPESIVSAFGSGFATSTLAASSSPLPTTLGGVTVKVRDSAGVDRLAPLFFVSPTQINYQIPAGANKGPSTISVTGGDGSVFTGTTLIADIAPGVFTANASGQGVAAAVALRVKADGSQQFEPIARFDQAQQRFVAIPIDLGPETDQVFLLLFGTGIRFRSALSTVTVKIGGLDAQATFAGALNDFVGLDQVNVRLPRGLVGRGEVDVALMVDGKPANTIRASIK